MAILAPVPPRKENATTALKKMAPLPVSFGGLLKAGAGYAWCSLALEVLLISLENLKISLLNDIFKALRKSLDSEPRGEED